MIFDNYFNTSDPKAVETKKTDTLIHELNKYKDLCKSLDTIIEHSDDGIFICDHNCIAIGANRAYEIISGIPKNEIPGKPVSYLVKKYTTDAASLQVRNTLMPHTTQYDFYKTGKKALVSSNPIFDDIGRLTMIVSTVRDITELEQLKNSLSQTEHLALKYKEEIKLVKSQFAEPSDVIAEDENMLQVLYKATKISKVNASVLIVGENGTGKEIIANYIFKNSNRSNKAFIKINCSTLPEHLMEAELFGVESTSVSDGKMGLFEVADKGTVFLDEICDLPLDIQAKLMRVLQDKEVVRVGGSNPIKIDVRIMASTNHNLKEMVEQRLFRQDLFYRLNVLPINVPPLRERRNDIIPLVKHFLAEANKNYQLNKEFTNSAYHMLMEYNWPGNIREVKNVVERAVIMSDSDFISANELSLTNITPSSEDPFRDGLDLKEYLERIEFDYINRTYEKFNSVRIAAAFLNMSKATFLRKRKLYAEKFGATLTDDMND